MRVVDKAVKGPLRQDWIGEERIPVLRSSVRYHHERAAAVAFTHELVEVLGLERGEIAQPKVVDDAEVGLKVGAHTSLESAVGVASAEIGK